MRNTTTETTPYPTSELLQAGAEEPTPAVPAPGGDANDALYVDDEVIVLSTN